MCSGKRRAEYHTEHVIGNKRTKEHRTCHRQQKKGSRKKRSVVDQHEARKEGAEGWGERETVREKQTDRQRQ